MQAKWYAIKSNCLHHCSRRDVNCYWHSLRKQQGIAPGAARRYAPRWWQLDPKIAADLHPFADGSAVRTPLVTGGGQAAGSCAMGQTDGRIPLFQNAPPHRTRTKGVAIKHRRKLLLGPGAQALLHFYDHGARLYDESPTFVTWYCLNCVSIVCIGFTQCWQIDS